MPRASPRHSKICEIDARPSDAIALAVAAGTPIYLVNDELL